MDPFIVHITQIDHPGNCYASIMLERDTIFYACNCGQLFGLFEVSFSTFSFVHPDMLFLQFFSSIIEHRLIRKLGNDKTGRIKDERIKTWWIRREAKRNSLLLKGRELE